MSVIRDTAERLYGDDGKKMATADLYNRIAKDAVRAVAIIGVDTDPKAPFFDNDYAEGIEGRFLRLVQQVGQIKHAVVLDTMAYKVGYDAHIHDATADNYDQLNFLISAYEASVLGIDQDPEFKDR